MAYINIEKLKFKYPLSESYVLSDISLEIEQGQIVVICGKTGCGKSTLLRNLKKEISPSGELEGTINIQTDNIGFVFQNPEHQIVTDKVFHELAFVLENEGVPSDIIRLRVTEIAEYFGITDWYFKSVGELSGGQKQILNLASVMVANPDVLILDEPISMLDPIAKETLLHLLRRINRDFGTTIIMSEHDIGAVKDLADKVLVLEDGKLSNNTGLWEKELEEYNAIKKEVEYIPDEKVLSCKNVWFRYKKDEPDVLRGLDFSVNKGEIFCMLGGNGTGKTTALLILSKVLKAYRGRVKTDKQIGLMPQDAKQLFACESVGEELDEVYKDEDKKNEVINMMGLVDLLKTHPYDLSGGEQQKLALAKVLSNNPEIILLDEPTKGLDIFFKEELAWLFKELKNQGKSIIIVTHDLAFCKKIADRCGLLGQGELIGVNTAEEFFKNAKFYK